MCERVSAEVDVWHAVRVKTEVHRKTQRCHWSHAWPWTSAAPCALTVWWENASQQYCLWDAAALGSEAVLQTIIVCRVRKTGRKAGGEELGLQVTLATQVGVCVVPCVLVVLEDIKARWLWKQINTEMRLRLIIWYVYSAGVGSVDGHNSWIWSQNGLTRFVFAQC